MSYKCLLTWKIWKYKREETGAGGLEEITNLLKIKKGKIRGQLKSQRKKTKSASKLNLEKQKRDKRIWKYKMRRDQEESKTKSGE